MSITSLLFFFQCGEIIEWINALINHLLILTIINFPGLIRVQDQLDYETQNAYQLTARATDSYSGKWAEVVVSVQVIDVNDNPPVFLQHFYNITVSEATAIATPILSVTTTDADTGLNAGVNYGVLGLNGTQPKNFYMEPTSGMLILKQGLDRETTPVHHFLVQAVDKGTPQLSSTAHVLVTVLDMNDNPPMFEQQSQRCVVTESAARGHFVTLMSASDEDISDVNKLTYSVVDGNDLQVFAINSGSGKKREHQFFAVIYHLIHVVFIDNLYFTISLGNILNIPSLWGPMMEGSQQLHPFLMYFYFSSGIVTVWNSQKLRETSHHVLNISVSDGVFTAYTRLLVSISPVNAHSPTFKVAQYSAHITENAALKTTIAQVSARDVDSGRYGDVTYHFIGDNAHKFFRINEITGKVC